MQRREDKGVQPACIDTKWQLCL